MATNDLLAIQPNELGTNDPPTSLELNKDVLESFDATPSAFFSTVVRPQYTCTVEVFRFTSVLPFGLHSNDVGEDLESEKLDISADVLTCKVHNSVTNGGDFSFSVPPNARWLGRVTVDDFVLITMGDGIRSAEPQMMGIIATINTDVRIENDGTRITSVTVAGQIFAKVLTDTELLTDLSYVGVAASSSFVSLFLSLMSSVSAPEWITSVNKRLVSSSEITRFLLKAFTARSVVSQTGNQKTQSNSLLRQWLFPFKGGGDVSGYEPFFKLILPLFSPTIGRTYYDPVVSQATRSMWDLMREWSDLEFNEFFCETYQRSITDPLICALVHRIKPWDPISLKDQASVTVHAVTDIFSYSLQRSTGERLNFFRVLPQDAGNVLSDFPISSRGDIALVNGVSAGQYGLRRKEVATKYWVERVDETGKVAPESVLETLGYLTKLVGCWNYRNDVMLQGRFTTRLIPGLKLGHTLRVKGMPTNDKNYVLPVAAAYTQNPDLQNADDTDFLFYVSEYTKTYQYPVGSVMEVVVSRGLPYEVATSADGEGYGKIPLLPVGPKGQSDTGEGFVNLSFLKELPSGV